MIQDGKWKFSEPNQSIPFNCRQANILIPLKGRKDYKRHLLSLILAFVLVRKDTFCEPLRKVVATTGNKVFIKSKSY